MKLKNMAALSFFAAANILIFVNCSGPFVVTANQNAKETQDPVGPLVVLPAPTSMPTTSWFGNSESGNPYSMQQDIATLFVKSDGTVITNSFWDEAGHESGIYKNGAILGGNIDLHGWGRNGGLAVAADTNYSYVAVSQGGCDGGSTANNQYGNPAYPPCGDVWQAIRRYNNDGSASSFQGHGWDGSFLLVNTNAKSITGVVAAGGKLYVSDPTSNSIKVYLTSDMSALTSFPATDPGPLAYDSNNTLWMIQKSTHKVIRYSNTGTLLSQSVSVSDPTALAIDSMGRLLVADNGADQNIKIYSNINTSPTLSTTFGIQGGTFAANGVMSPLRFYGISGIGTDALGNIYVGLNGNGHQAPSIITGDLRVFSPTGTLLHRNYCNEFVSIASADPDTDGLDVYSTTFHYKMDFSQVGNGLEAKEYGFTLNYLKYPNDPRIQLGGISPVAVRTIQGQKFTYHHGQMTTGLIIYRYEGDTAIPSAWINAGGQVRDRDNQPYPASMPATGGWNWRDLNGDGEFQANEFTATPTGQGTWAWSVDANGTIWTSSTSQKIRKFPLYGLDVKGNPIYRESDMVEYTLPAGNYTEIRRVIYIPDSDTLFVAGYTNNASDDGCWSVAGKNISRYDNFTSGTSTQRWQITTPYDCAHRSVPTGFDIAGNAVFTVDVSNATGGGNPKVHVYSTDTGSNTLSFNVPSSVLGETGWTDVPYALRAFSRRNGQYVVFVEDDLHGKIILFTWPGQY